jgi:TolB protein
MFLIFTRRKTYRSPGDLMRHRLADGATEPFASRPESDDNTPAPSPVRDEIVFVSDRSGNGDLFLVDLHGDEPRNLTETPSWDERAPHWSPDGALLNVTLLPPDSAPGSPAVATRIRVIDRHGRVIQETPGRMADWMPAWTDE